MWGESVDISDQLQRIWPKSAAVAGKYLLVFTVTRRRETLEL